MQYWSYADVWLPNDANFEATNQAAQQVEQIIRQQAELWDKQHPGKDGKPSDILRYVTTWVGGGSPRFWFSLSPQAQQLNYAEVLVELTEKEATPEFVDQVQPVLSATVPGARIDMRQLQTNPVNYPVEIRVTSRADVGTAGSAQDIQTMRQIASQVADILRTAPMAARVRNEWDTESANVSLNVDPDRANLAGITNMDVANSATSAMSGVAVTALQDGDRNIPVVARLKMDERAKLSDIQNLYVFGSQSSTKIPLVQISSIENSMSTDRIIRLDHFRTMSLYAFPAPGHLASEIMTIAVPKLQRAGKDLTAGLRTEHRRRVRQAEDGIPESGRRAGSFDLSDLPGAALPVQQCDQAVPGVCGRALRRGGRADRAVDHEYFVRLHGVSWGSPA